MRVHIEDDTDAARLAATQTSGLCGLARVNGRFVTLHDLGQQESRLCETAKSASDRWCGSVARISAFRSNLLTRE
jgi:hypothetical protein